VDKAVELNTKLSSLWFYGQPMKQALKDLILCTNTQPQKTCRKKSEPTDIGVHMSYSAKSKEKKIED
jgi:hypothetical protein